MLDDTLMKFCRFIREAFSTYYHLPLIDSATFTIFIRSILNLITILCILFRRKKKIEKKLFSAQNLVLHIGGLIKIFRKTFWVGAGEAAFCENVSG